MDQIANTVIGRLLESAKRLFFRYGIRKVSVVEICREAGVSKMSFYRHFRDKEEIAIKVLEMYFNQRMATFEAILEENIGFEDKLFKIAGIKAAQMKTASNEFVRDIMADGESALGKFVTDLTAKQIGRTRELFISFQKSGDIRNDIKVDLIMYVIEHLWRGVHEKKLLAVYDDASQLYEEMFRVIYYGILPPGDKKSEIGSR